MITDVNFRTHAQRKAMGLMERFAQDFVLKTVKTTKMNVKFHTIQILDAPFLHFVFQSP